MYKINIKYIKGENDGNIAGDFNTPLDRSSREKINMATQILNDTIEQFDLVEITSSSLLLLLLLLSRFSPVRLCATP